MIAKIFGDLAVGQGYKVPRLVAKLSYGRSTAQHRPMAPDNHFHAGVFDPLNRLEIRVDVEVGGTQRPTYSIEGLVSGPLDSIAVVKRAVLSIVDSQMPVAVPGQVPDLENAAFAQS